MKRWLLSFMLLGSTAHAANCADWLLPRNRYAPAIRALFTSEDAVELRERLRARFHDLTYDDAGFTRATEIYFEERMLTLPEEFALKMRDWYAKAKIFTTENRRLNGHYSLGFDHVRIFLPAEFHRSFTFGMILAHEIEHRLQRIRVPRTKKWLAREVQHVDDRFALEVGAILAESAFYSALPAEFLAREIERIDILRDAGRATPSAFYEVGLRAAIDQVTPVEYLRATWATGRYTRKSILHNQLRDYYFFSYRLSDRLSRLAARLWLAPNEP